MDSPTGALLWPSTSYVRPLTSSDPAREVVAQKGLDFWQQRPPPPPPQVFLESRLQRQEQGGNFSSPAMLPSSEWMPQTPQRRHDNVPTGLSSLTASRFDFALTEPEPSHEQVPKPQSVASLSPASVASRLSPPAIRGRHDLLDPQPRYIGCPVHDAAATPLQHQGDRDPPGRRGQAAPSMLLPPDRVQDRLQDILQDRQRGRPRDGERLQERLQDYSQGYLQDELHDQQPLQDHHLPPPAAARRGPRYGISVEGAAQATISATELLTSPTTTSSATTTIATPTVLLTASRVPSSAVFVKDFDKGTTAEDLERIFGVFLDSSNEIDGGEGDDVNNDHGGEYDDNDNDYMGGADHDDIGDGDRNHSRNSRRRRYSDDGDSGDEWNEEGEARKSVDSVLVAGHFDRGFAFCDLGSREAVARAVNQSRSEQGVVDGAGRRLKVEPSKKPVRPSGLRALNERQTSAGSVIGGGGGGGGGGSYTNGGGNGGGGDGDSPPSPPRPKRKGGGSVGRLVGGRVIAHASGVGSRSVGVAGSVLAGPLSASTSLRNSNRKSSSSSSGRFLDNDERIRRGNHEASLMAEHGHQQRGVRGLHHESAHEPSWNDPPCPIHPTGDAAPPRFAAPASPFAEAGGVRSGNQRAVEPEGVPSSAVFIKNVENTMEIEELKAIFRCFLDDDYTEDIKVAGHFDRGFAFCDLGSREAVARAVNQSRSEQGVVDGAGRRLKVEPSKKPVRPSGLRALNERQTSAGSVIGSGSYTNGATRREKKMHHRVRVANRRE